MKIKLYFKGGVGLGLSALIKYETGVSDAITVTSEVVGAHNDRGFIVVCDINFVSDDKKFSELNKTLAHIKKKIKIKNYIKLI